MTARSLRFALGILVLGAALTLSLRRNGSLPPLGPLLDPARGIWALARTADHAGQSHVALGSLTKPVTVVFDRSGVPHIFAATAEDAYRALGYVEARDRLFQMELQTRSAAGTLSEVLGSRALRLDREVRRLGFPGLVERAVEAFDSTSPGGRSIQAYAEGVTGWLNDMTPADLPFEYRLLGKTPGPWSVANTYFLLARMGLTLAANDASLLKAAATGLVGAAAAEALFPLDAPIQEPIQPNGAGAPRVGFTPLPPPGTPDPRAALVASTLHQVSVALGLRPRTEDAIALGSNNWAVSPGKTAAGAALLAGDPHLELTVPSIWYQAHLVVPGQLDVAGVTIPGAPWVLIGMNRDIAWSMTNTGSDVSDFYAETVDDSLAPARYRLDGDWRPVTRRIEMYHGPTGALLATDTVYFTHRGPMVRVNGAWVSMAWTLYDKESGGAAFVGMNRSRSVREFLDASQGYGVPTQNMIVADRHGTIAIRSTGRYPVRPGDGRGDVIRDGTLSRNDWTGSLGHESYPFAIDPAQGFLASANQQPVDPAQHPRFLGANWYSPWRAIRINQILRARSAITPDSMRRFQTDPASPRADAFVPALIEIGSRHAAGHDTLAEAVNRLRSWDRRYTRENTGAVLFETVMDELVARTWDELNSPARPADGAPLVPEGMILAGLLQDSANVWWDDRRTSAVRESRDDIVVAALVAGYRRTVAEHGAPDSGGWTWSRAHTANIYHLLRLPALSALGLPVQGGPSTLNPSSGSGTHGPSWRMVVELAGTVRAWATYPGGQSGNPASRHYLDRLPRWVAGTLDAVRLPTTPNALDPADVESRLILEPRTP